MYAPFYKLSAEPFLLTPDESFFFESSVHAQAMAHLTYGLSRGEGFIVITGEIGAGKTTLVKRLCASIDRQAVLFADIATTLLSGTDLLAMVAGAFKLKNIPEAKGPLLLKFQELFESAHRSGKRVLLIVDEAQNLSHHALEELRMLSNFQIGNAAPFQSFLLGQPQFREVLASRDLEQFRQRIIASYHLGPMNRKECRDYVLHRLRHVGWHDDPVFEADAFDAIFDCTEGVPRRINALCSRLMLYGFLDELHRLDAGDVSKVAADLNAEGYSNGARAPIAAAATASASREDFASLVTRIAELEAKLERHERSFRRATQVAYDLLRARSMRASPSQ